MIQVIKTFSLNLNNLKELQDELLIFLLLEWKENQLLKCLYLNSKALMEQHKEILLIFIKKIKNKTKNLKELVPKVRQKEEPNKKIQFMHLK